VEFAQPVAGAQLIAPVRYLWIAFAEGLLGINCSSGAGTRICVGVMGHPRYGLPFGQDRLVPILLAIGGAAAVADDPIQAGVGDVGDLAV